MKRMNRLVKSLIVFGMCTVISFSGIGTVHVAHATSAQPTTEEVSHMPDPNGVLGRNSDVSVELTESVIGEIKKPLDLKFTLKSTNLNSIKIKDTFPVVDEDFPFETSNDAYKITSAGEDVELQKAMPVAYNLTARKDLKTGYHSTRFVVEYTKDGEDYYIIKTINIYFRGNGNIQEDDVSGDDSEENGSVNPFAGAEDSEDIGSIGGSGSAPTSTPKLIITGYDTVPKRVMAGDTFNLTIHVKNTSKSTTVSNAKFLIGNETGNILPTSGSSSIFVDKIGPGQTGDLEIEMKTSADLAQKSYVVVVKGDFDDGKGNNFTYSESLYLPIFQEVKLAISEVSMTPEFLGVGEEGTLMFTINNQGKAGVYNATVRVDDENVVCDDVYIGNIASAASAYASLNVTGMMDNTLSGGEVKVVISYEDSEGEKYEYEEMVLCSISDSAGEFGFDDFEDDMMMEEEQGPNVKKIIIIVVIVLVLIGAIVGAIIFFVMRKKKKALLEEEDDFLDEDI